MTSAPEGIFQLAADTANFISEQLPAELKNPQVGVICGSGLGGLADTVHSDVKHEIPYADIPNFAKSTGNLTVCYNTAP